MKILKKLMAILALLPAFGIASEGGYPLEHFESRITELSALQNGAKLFVNYCLYCHSASSMRYNRLKDIGLTEDQIKNNLLFTSDKVGDLMKVAMSVQDGKDWFGVAPPDMSVIARAKPSEAGSGVVFLFSFLCFFFFVVC